MPEINMRDFERVAQQALQELGDDIEAELDAVMADASTKLVRRLRTGKKHGGKTPEDTGRYAAGWVEQSEMHGVSRVRVIRNADNPQLTHLLEYGTPRMQAQPHIRPAVEDTIEEMSADLQARLGGRSSGA